MLRTNCKLLGGRIRTLSSKMRSFSSTTETETEADADGKGKVSVIGECDGQHTFRRGKKVFSPVLIAGGCGMRIYDRTGVILAKALSFRALPGGAEDTEVFACFKTIEAADNLSIQGIQLRSDCNDAIKKVENTKDKLTLGLELTQCIQKGRFHMIPLLLKMAYLVTKLRVETRECGKEDTFLCHHLGKTYYFPFYLDPSRLAQEHVLIKLGKDKLLTEIFYEETDYTEKLGQYMGYSSLCRRPPSDSLLKGVDCQILRPGQEIRIFNIPKWIGEKIFKMMIMSFGEIRHCSLNDDGSAEFSYMDDRCTDIASRTLNGIQFWSEDASETLDGMPLGIHILVAVVSEELKTKSVLLDTYEEKQLECDETCTIPSFYIKLSLSASKLRDLDIVSKSDPMAVGYAKKRDGTLEEIGRTEVIMNTLDPVWMGKFSISFQFETVQPLVFRVFDVDPKLHNVPVMALKLDQQDFLGEATCFLSQIASKRNKSLTLQLQESDNHQRGMKNLGELTVHAEEPVDSRQAVEMVFRCSKLENKDPLSKSDLFLRISRIVEGGNPIPICKTEVVNNNLNPTWKPVCLTMQQFGSKDNPVLIECFDFNSSGNHELIGKIQKSVASLENLNRKRVGEIFYIQPSVRKDHMKILKSQLVVDVYREKQLYSFIDYISSGFELKLMVAVDFTDSNGNPRMVESLHYIDPMGRLNAYQQVISEVGEVIQYYDSEKRFPAWGFGGRINGSVSHCFNLNGSLSDSEVEGVNGIMSAYSSALHHYTLAGPTLFEQVINRAAQIASQSLSCNQNKYYVLLIITDGVVTDLQETKDALVKASDLPLSVHIVGVGGADFREMEILDADNGERLESSTGHIATRDIVQFVPMREVHGGQVYVVQSLLQELPGQFLAYMRSREIVPQFVNEGETSTGA